MMSKRMMSVCAVLFGCVTLTQADENYLVPLPGPFQIGGANVPSPAEVPGKELSFRGDVTTTTTPHSPDPGQTQNWAGDGRIADGTDFGNVITLDLNPQVDALAARRDALFFDASFNQAPIIITIEGDTNIHYEAPSGARGVWATAAQISHEHNQPPRVVDALEVYGPEILSDANHFSLEGDPFNFAIFNENGSVYATRNQISDSVALLLGLNDPDDRATFASLSDLDALMSFESGSVDGQFDAGDQLLISYMPLTMNLRQGGSLSIDGGEIFYIDVQAIAVIASYLNHGGHLWDTAFDVRAAFDVDSENVFALEAVGSTIPTPGAFAGGLALLAALGLRRWRL